jgi:hypothetical protein
LEEEEKEAAEKEEEEESCQEKKKKRKRKKKKKKEFRCWIERRGLLQGCQMMETVEVKARLGRRWKARRGLELAAAWS